MTTPGILRRVLPGDESVVAGLGLGAAAVVVITSATLWWVTVRAERDAIAQGRINTAQVLTGALAQSVETMLANDELSSVRRLLTDVGREGKLGALRIELADGGIIADSDPGRITLQQPPGLWPPVGEPASGLGFMQLPLRVHGKGEAVLRVELSGEAETVAPSMAEAWVGGVSAAALAALGLLYRTVRRRTRGLAAISDALRAAAGGEKEPRAMEVDERYGPQAIAWNTLLGELLRLRAHHMAHTMVDGSGESPRATDDLAAACDALWHGLVVVDDELRVRYANGAAAVFLASRREGLLGAELTSRLGDEQVAAALRPLVGGNQRTRVVVERAIDPTRDDAVFRISGRTIGHREAGGAVVLIEDVTQQRVADKSRNAFVAQVTHELRTPLTNMRLYVESLLEKPDTDEATRAQFMNIINGEVRRLERIVGDMLSVSEIEAGTLQLATDDVRLGAMMEDLERDFRYPAQAKNIKLKFALPPKLPVVVADRDKLLLAISNLIGNALKYTPEGGEVTVRVREDTGMLAFDVCDTGLGIAEEESELIFERFYRSKDQRIDGISGSGLGLALARQVVRLHGGDITLESAVGKGSTFTITLPKCAPLSLAA
jgi:signal transduction histidine kinase